MSLSCVLSHLFYVLKVDNKCNVDLKIEIRIGSINYYVFMCYWWDHTVSITGNVGVFIYSGRDLSFLVLVITTFSISDKYQGNKRRI